MEEGVGIIDFINRIVQTVKINLKQFRISIQEAELMEPMEL